MRMLKKIQIICLLFGLGFSVSVVADGNRFYDALSHYEKQRYNESFDTFFQLSKEGVPSASAMLIKHYDEGLGVTSDPVKAMSYLGLVVTQMDNFNPEYGYQIGLMFFRLGEVSLALEQFTTAAKYKHSLATYEVARYKLNELEPQILEASMWAMIATSYGSAEAETLRPIVQNLLNDKLLKEALQLRKQWFEANSSENLKKEMDQLRQVIETMGILTDVLGDLVNAVEVDIDKEAVIKAIEKLPEVVK